MSEVFAVPEEVLDRINEIFPNSEERRKLAYTLMFWNKKPNSAERQEMAEKVGRERSTVNLIMKSLSEEGLFTDDFGSVPLFQYTEKMRLSLETPQVLEPITPHTDETDIPSLPEVLGEEEEKRGSQEPEKSPLSVEMPPSKELEKRIALTEANIKGLGTRMETGFKGIEEAIQKLSVAPAGDNPSKSNPVKVSQPASQQVPPADNPGPVQQQMEQSAVEPIGALLPGLSRDQLIEIATNQPGQIRALMGLPPRSDEGIESLPITTRVVAVELTTYTQSVFERVVHDGYDGSMSDFLNDAAYKYFADRGKRLDWVDTKRDRRRLP